MTKKNVKLLAGLGVVLLVAMIVEIYILNSFNRRNLDKTSTVLLDQVVSILEKNSDDENGLVETLKEEYIVRAKSVCYILDVNPSAEYDVSELKKIAELLRIDEIHLFDETGVIYSGSEPKYYGYNFDSGEQISYFKPMLEDKTLTMCQDVTPNTAEGKSMMYAITWNDAGTYMIQVGIEPLRLLEELRNNEISEVISDMPVYDGVNILVAYSDTGEICGSTVSDLVGSSLDDIGYVSGGTKINLNGKGNYYNARQSGEYTVITSYSLSATTQNYELALGIELLYLLFMGLIIVHMFDRVIRTSDEKRAQMSLLVSIADIYNSMHIIDLKNNSFVEYHARDELSHFVKEHSENGAVDTMVQAITATTLEEDLDRALVFTDITTVRDRLHNRKIITDEFRSKVIGWYRSSFITIEKDDDGYPTKLVFVTRDIDSDKKREEELVYKSNYDELTGLLNRRAYEDSIAEYNDIVPDDDFVFVSLDVNGLKTTNDTKGHVAGDELLVGAAECMKRCFGQYGRIFRTGGDEFAIILFTNSQKLDEIIADFEDMTSKWSGDLVDSISVSCGYVIGSEEKTKSVHEIAKIADQRMYDIKARHYGRVV